VKTKLRQRVLQYAAVFEPDEERGGYTVYIPALPGCISEGDTFEEALRNIQEAAALYLEVMAERRERPEPSSNGVFVAPVRVTV
jgi:predicted RNase H-like HicB family nuclease